MKIRDIVEILGAYTFILLMILIAPLGVYGIMNLFDFEWWKAGIAFILIQMIPFVNTVGTLILALIGFYYLIIHIFHSIAH